MKTNSFMVYLGLLALAVTTCYAKANYENFQLLRLKIENTKQADLVEKWESFDKEFDVWNSGSGKSPYADILLSPDSLNKYYTLFEVNNISYEVLQSNIQTLIDEEKKLQERSQLLRNSIINKFATYTEISSFIDDIVTNNPSIASSYFAGEDKNLKTEEERLLKVVVLKTTQSSKPVWIDCGIHAREWVAPASCVYIIDTLVKEHQENPATSLLNTYEFHILPLVNPDGYEYSRTNSRLWRKNRGVNRGTTCRGTDLNRNYDFNWLVNSGASSNPCSDIFAGPSADSEPETRAVQEAINKKLGEWIGFFTVHSYGQWWLVGYAHTTDKLPDYDDLKRVGDAAISAISSETTDNTRFVFGQSSTSLYLNCGSSRDWARGVANVTYSYTLELRPGQGSPDSSYGFLLPENRLPNLTKETLAGIKAAIAAIN